MIYLRNDDVVLFQGDSITHGGRGLNQADLNHVLGHGYQEMLAGRMALENMERTPSFLNRGVSGDRLRDLAERWEQDTLALRPTVLSILVGVNDCHVPKSGLDRIYDKEFRALLDRTKEALPDVRLIICEPFAFMPPQIGGEEERAFYQKRIELLQSFSVHAQIIAREYEAVFVPFWFALLQQIKRTAPERVIWDGIHPTTLGHTIMADTWYRAVQNAGILREP